MVSSIPTYRKEIYLIILSCLHTDLWLQVFLFNANNFETDLFNP